EQCGRQTARRAVVRDHRSSRWVPPARAAGGRQGSDRRARRGARGVAPQAVRECSRSERELDACHGRGEWSKGCRERCEGTNEEDGEVVPGGGPGTTTGLPRILRGCCAA